MDSNEELLMKRLPRHNPLTPIFSLETFNPFLEVRRFVLKKNTCKKKNIIIWKYIIL